MKIRIKKIFAFLLIILLIGFLLPQSFRMPVKGTTRNSFSQDSFWFYPWGESVTHKGVDIFAKKGTTIHSSTYGIVLILGPKWRLHYYAHLDSIKTSILKPVNCGSVIGTVGNSGNAVGKPPHLHYTIKTLVPYPWRIDKSIQGWKKMYYLNPVTYPNECL